MTNKQRNLYIAMLILLNGICFMVTGIKERVIYPLLDSNSWENTSKWNAFLSLIWKYSEYAIVLIVICIVLFYWIKRKELIHLLEIKISVGLFLSIFLVEIVLGKLFQLPIGNIVQPVLWITYIPSMLFVLFLIQKLKKT